MDTIPHSDVSQHRTGSQVGRVSGVEKVREPEVLWCEMPGAVNYAGGGDDVVAEASILSENESSSGY